jgi:O-antigen/teichoic acid export membrane protein
MSSPNLKDKTVSGMGWSAIDSIASQGITFLVGLVLARLLSPIEFGTIGVAMIFVTLFNTIVDSGFSSALIRKLDVRDIDYNTTFIFNFVVSIILYAICYFGSPYIAEFFHNEDLVQVVRWISIVLIINAIAIIQRTIFVKEINFKTQAKISLFASLFSGVIGICMAFQGFGVFSLVGQQLSRQLSNTVLLWVNSKWRPKFVFSYKSFKDLFSFGGKLLLSSVIDTICGELSIIFIGKIYTPATLGQYTRAKQFSSLFSSNLSAITQRVTYPVLSDLQNNEEQLIEYYRKMMKSLMLIVAIGTAIIAGCAKPIILILLGSKWTEAILYLQLLAFVEITVPIKNINLNLLQVYGRSDYILYLSIIKRIIEIGAITLGFIGLPWMIIGFAVAGVVGFLLNAFCTMKASGLRVWTQIKDLLPSLLLGCMIGVFMYITSYFLDNVYYGLIIQIAIGLFVFLYVDKIAKLEEYMVLKTLFSSYLKKICNKL